VICDHGARLADFVSNVDELQDQIFNFILKIRDHYKANSERNLNNLRKAFLAQFDSEKLAHRRACEYWRSIRFTILNDVPRRFFLLTNWKRMEQKQNEGWESSDSDTASSVFQDLSPLSNFSDHPEELPERLINIAIDASAAHMLEHENSEDADGQFTAPAQAPQKQKNPNTNKRKRKRKNKGTSSGRPFTSKFVRVLDGDVFVCHRSELCITAIFRKSSFC
jgi:hypothetical protein